jgi:DNA-binding CsgD family transcriptional regulator
VNRNPHIIIAEPAAIIFEGLAAIFLRSDIKPYLSWTDSLSGIQQLHLKRKSDLIIVNPSLLQNNSKHYYLLKKQFENSPLIGLVYAYYEPQLLAQFDATIAISDPPELILATLNKMLYNESKEQGQLQDVLSDREIEVLKLLASGLANKEIADKLNISINTVITHRKNISQKTGIKSISGLTIYAVVQKFVTLEDLSE